MGSGSKGLTCCMPEHVESVYAASGITDLEGVPESRVLGHRLRFLFCMLRSSARKMNSHQKNNFRALPPTKQLSEDNQTPTGKILRKTAPNGV